MTHSASPPRTVLFVHAHPDDETLATGVTLAQRVLDGDDVHVLTLTLGDEGEVIPEDLRHHQASEDDDLGEYRRVELRRAMHVLGVVEHVVGESTLGPGKARYRDSGMAGTPSMAHPRALCQAPLAELVAAIADHLQALRPSVVVTYDARGGYEHPDHIRVHQATCAAVAAVPEADRPSLWAVVTRRSVAAADRAWVAEHAPRDAGLVVPAAEAPYPPSVLPDEQIPWDVRGSGRALARRDAALREHETQVRVGEGWFALSNDIAARLPVQESYVEIDPATGAALPANPERIDPRRAP